MQSATVWLCGKTVGTGFLTLYNHFLESLLALLYTDYVYQYALTNSFLSYMAGGRRRGWEETPSLALDHVRAQWIE